MIDLLNGVVVHAKLGQRAHYQPIQSALTSSTHPVHIVKAFQAIYAFDTLYIADLNAIQRTPEQANNIALIGAIQAAFPNLTIWLDAGIKHSQDLAAWQRHTLRLVLGSESFNSLADYLAVTSQLTIPPILSLDFMPQGYVGPAEFISQSEHWPAQVIIMSLKHVGSHQGPDLTTILSMQALAKQHQLYAAGGVRNAKDLTQLKQHHIHGAMLATALHQQHMTAADLMLAAQ